MRNIAYIAGALAIVAGLHFSGLLDKTVLTHPFWRQKVTLYGSLIGAGLAGGMFWVGWHKARLGRAIGVAFGGVFLISLAVTLYAAKVFIDSEVFEATAGSVWYFGAYTVFASAVVWFSSLLAFAKNIGKTAN